MIGGLFLLFLVARSDRVDRVLSRLIARGLNRWTEIDARDDASLLHVGGDYSVVEMRVGRGDWMAGRTVRELDLRSRGVLLLGVTRAGGETSACRTGTRSSPRGTRSSCTAAATRCARSSHPRRAARRIFPLVVLGRSSAKSTMRGYL